MTEAEWLACREPQKMLAFLGSSGKATNRKLRAFAADCARRVVALLDTDAVDHPHDPQRWIPYVRHAVDVLERFIDGRATVQDVWNADVPPFDWTNNAVWTVATALESCRFEGSEVAGCALAAACHAVGAHQLRSWRPGSHPPRHLRQSLQTATTEAEHAAQAAALRDVFGPLPFRPLPPLASSVLAWSSGCIVTLAAGIYEERDFSEERMGVLADALEEAGVTDEEVLGHCRTPKALHLRGCWLVDAILKRA
jgi:hypothetical protein